MENNNEINTRKNKTEFNTYRDWDTRWEMKLDTLLIILTLNRLQIEEWDKKKQTNTHNTEENKKLSQQCI